MGHFKHSCSSLCIKLWLMIMNENWNKLKVKVCFNGELQKKLKKTQTDLNDCKQSQSYDCSGNYEQQQKTLRVRNFAQKTSNFFWPPHILFPTYTGMRRDVKNPIVSNNINKNEMKFTNFNKQFLTSSEIYFVAQLWGTN